MTPHNILSDCMHASCSLGRVFASSSGMTFYKKPMPCTIARSSMLAGPKYIGNLVSAPLYIDYGALQNRIKLQRSNALQRPSFQECVYLHMRKKVCMHNRNQRPQDACIHNGAMPLHDAILCTTERGDQLAFYAIIGLQRLAIACSYVDSTSPSFGRDSASAVYYSVVVAAAVLVLVFVTEAFQSVELHTCLNDACMHALDRISMPM